MYRAFLFGLFLTFSFGAAHAATINIASQSRASAFATPTNPMPGDSDFDIIDNVDTLGGPIRYSASTAAVETGASASSSGSAEIDTGLLRSRTRATLPPSHATTGHEASGATEVVMDIGFTASASGNVTFQLAVDGFWDLVKPDVAAVNWQAQGKLGLLDSGGLRLRAVDDFRLNNTLSPSTGVFDDILEFDFFVRDSEDYVISTSLLTQIVSGEGIIDFSSTAALHIIPDPGVVLTFDDPRVLTVDPGATPVVPLPAGVWMLLAALASLTALRLHRSAT